MFTVDEATAEAIRRAYQDGGELAGVVELRRHYSLLTEGNNARLRVRAIAEWGGQAKKAVEAAIAGIVDAAKNGDEINLLGFGKFKVKDSQPARAAIPPLGRAPPRRSRWRAR
jgi:hypothetical protein